MSLYFMPVLQIKFPSGITRLIKTVLISLNLNVDARSLSHHKVADNVSKH